MHLYSKASRFIIDYKLTLFSDVVILFSSGYLLTKKAFGFSISGWLLNNLLHQPAVNVYVFISGIILVVAILIKAMSLIFEYFPAIKHSVTEPEEISECLQVMNNEICTHIKKCDSNESPNIRKLREQHAFDVNTRLIAESLAEHIRRSIGSMKIKRKDLFISLYSFEEKNNNLKYEFHYDPKRDLIKSKVISLNENAFKNYECVKCMLSEDSTAYVTSKASYAKGNPKRHKSFTQYMGCKLETNGSVFGFLNIEFHNFHVFIDEDEMQDFREENIFPFKLLLEYQYLKGQFFSKFEKLEEHWEVN